MSVPYLSDLDLHSGVTQEAPCLEVILVEVSGEMNGGLRNELECNTFHPLCRAKAAIIPLSVAF